MTPPAVPGSKLSGAPARRPPARAPLPARKHAAREQARRLVRARARTTLTGEQRAGDPLDHRRPGIARRAGWVLAALLAAGAIHVGVVTVGFLIGGKDPGRRERIEQAVRVEMREPPPPPPPADEKKAEPPRPQPEPKAVRPPPVKKAPPPPAEAPKGPPPRVVGINLESTTEGGNGPAFAVGDTHDGRTADRAAAPVKAEAPAAPPPPAPGPRAVNQAASHLPVAGVEYKKPQRPSPMLPPYPETLKAQGIEADVTVLVTIDEQGKVTSAKVIKPAPYPEFNEAARATALKEQWQPATRDGVPMPYTVSYMYRFRLEAE